jgi:betaine reductase
MGRELERAGIPVAHICTMINVSKGMGGNRLVPSRSVLYPTGDPELTPAEEFKLRQKIVSYAMEAIQTAIQEPQIFEKH